MRRIAFGLVVLGTVLVGLPALAQPAPANQIEIVLEGNLFGTPGETYEVHRQSIDSELVGLMCTGTADTTNNESEHPHNDLIIASGDQTAVIYDFEAVSDMVTSTEEALVLGETLTLSIRLGEDGVSSERLVVILNCSQPPPPTTTTTTTAPPPVVTTTTAPPPVVTTTTAPPPVVTTTTRPPQVSETTEPPPRGGVSAGGGGMAATPNDAAVWLTGGVMLMAAALLLAATGRGMRRKSD
jgi:hypothetical protein